MGKAERFRWVDGYEGIYQISDRGRVRSVARRVINSAAGSTRRVRERFLRLQPDGSGYLTAHLCDEGGRRAVHVASLVASAFLGLKPPPLEVLHNDGVKTNNHWRNLRYGTRAENMADARKHDTWARGERQGSARLTEKKVRRILKDPRPSVILAAEFGVSYGHIRAIKTRKAWAWLTSNRK